MKLVKTFATSKKRTNFLQIDDVYTEGDHQQEMVDLVSSQISYINN